MSVNVLIVTVLFSLMLHTIILIAFSISTGLTLPLKQYEQNDYVVTDQRFELVRYDNKYISNPVIRNFKYNRTNFAVNLTFGFNVDLNRTLVYDFQAYKFASNEYRLFPVSFPINFCDVIDNNLFGLKQIYGCGNVFRCPIVKGRYKFCNWSPAYGNYPPYIPKGQYMLEIKWMTSSIIMMTTHFYLTIKDIPIQY